MANDIALANSGNPIQHGTAIIYTDKLGNIQRNTAYTYNKPVITDIDDKYDNRFDDPRYYSGDTPDWGYPWENLDIKLVNFGLLW